MVILRQFIDSIVELPALRSSIYFLNFIKISNQKEFRKSKELLNKRLCNASDLRNNVKAKMTGKDRVSIEDFTSLTGELHARVGPEISNFAMNLKQF